MKKDQLLFLPLAAMLLMVMTRPTCASDELALQEEARERASVATADEGEVAKKTTETSVDENKVDALGQGPYGGVQDQQQTEPGNRDDECDRRRRLLRGSHRVLYASLCCGGCHKDDTEGREPLVQDAATRDMILDEVNRRHMAGDTASIHPLNHAVYPALPRETSEEMLERLYRNAKDFHPYFRNAGFSAHQGEWERRSRPLCVYTSLYTPTLIVITLTKTRYSNTRSS